MDKTEILTQMNDVFKSVFENDNLEVTNDTDAGMIEEWDSLTHTILLAAIQKHFKVKFKLREIMGFNKVGDTIESIHSKLSA